MGTINGEVTSILTTCWTPFQCILVLADWHEKAAANGTSCSTPAAAIITVRVITLSLLHSGPGVCTFLRFFHSVRLRVSLSLADQAKLKDVSMCSVLVFFLFGMNMSELVVWLKSWPKRDEPSISEHIAATAEVHQRHCGK